MVSRFGEGADVVAALVATLAAAVAFMALDDGSPVRLAVVAPAIAVVPGYLLLEALARGPTAARARWSHLLIGLGLSPAIVGVLALATALVPGGFKAPAIVVMVTVGSLALCWVVLERRQEWLQLAEAERPRTATRPG